MGEYGYTIIMIVAMVAILYFLMIRPESKRKKAAQNMRDSLAVGDEITTIGGITGTIWRGEGEYHCFREWCRPRPPGSD